MRYLSVRRYLALGALFSAALIVLGTAPWSRPEPTPSSNADALYYPFNSDGTLYETSAMRRSTSPYWWLSSGAMMNISDGVGRTAMGSLPAENEWRLLYVKDNPVDTDDGYRPQNIFRLVTKTKWTNYVEEGYFWIDQINVSPSPNRNESNGILFFNRYQDDDNLYYAGVRVDGYAVIKKKVRGVYHTMAYTPFFPGLYNRASSPNLLPLRNWIGLRVFVVNTDAHTVNISLYIDAGGTGDWALAAQASDDGTKFGGAAFLEPGHGGIRTDFMDVAFDNFAISKFPSQSAMGE